MLAQTLADLPKLADLVNEDGEPQAITLLPPATDAEIRALRAKLPAPLPPDLLAALRVTKGLDQSPLDALSLVDLERFGMDDAFPHSYSLGADGFGNFWILDPPSDAADWGPVWYACHDPPVIAYQARTIEHFVLETVKLWQPGASSEVDLVHERVVMQAWGSRTAGLSQTAALSSPDTVLRDFAQTLPPEALIHDLRNAKVGDAFAWGAFGFRTSVLRWQHDALWAVVPPPKRSFLQALFSRR